MLLLLTIFTTALVGSVTCSESPTVSIEPQVISDPSMGPGTQFEVDVVVNYVEKLWAYQIALGDTLFEIQGFNPAVLNLVAIENGPFLGSAGGQVEWFPGEIENSIGTLELSGAALNPKTRFPTGGGVLATLTFEVVGYGQSPIHFDLETGLLDSNNEWIVRGTIDSQALKDGFFANVADADPEPPPEKSHDIHDVAVLAIRAYPTSGYPGVPIDIDVTIENQGGFEEAFDVLVYAVKLGDDLHIDVGSEMVSLDVGASDTLLFIWDTTDVPPGSYWVIAEAVLPEDSDLGDNTRRALVGGLYPRNTPNKASIFDLLASFGVLVLIVGLGAVPIVFFELLMSPKLRWSRLLSKQRAHNTTK